MVSHFTSPTVQMTLVVPAFTPVTTPFSLTVAMAVSSIVHVSLFVLGSMLYIVQFRSTDCPTVMVKSEFGRPKQVMTTRGVLSFGSGVAFAAAAAAAGGLSTTRMMQTALAVPDLQTMFV